MKINFQWFPYDGVDYNTERGLKCMICNEWLTVMTYQKYRALTFDAWIKLDKKLIAEHKANSDSHILKELAGE